MTKKMILMSNKDSRNQYLHLFLFIIFTSLILYWQYIFGDKTLVYTDMGYDTFHQYVPVMEFFSESIKNNTLSQYTFQYGYGDSTFSMMSWMADPFTMISVLTGVVFGSERIAESIVYTQILKNLSAGILAYWYLTHLGFSRKSSMLSAYVYAFSGFIMTAGQHYAFGVLPVYNIMLLVCIEKLLDKANIKNFVLTVLAVCLICIKGSFYAYMIMLGAAFYTIFRLIYINGKKGKSFFTSGIVIFLSVLFGIMISAPFFLPSIESILSSTRLSSSSLFDRIFSNLALTTPQVIRSSLLRLFSNSIEGTVNSWSGAEYHWEMFSCFFSVMIVPLAFQFIYYTFSVKRTIWQRIARLIPVLVFIFAVISNFIPNMFNGFIYPAYRYAFCWLPLFAIMMSDVLDNVNRCTFNRVINYIAVALSCVTIALGGYYTYKSGNNTTIVPTIMAIVFVVGGSFLLDLVYSANCVSSQEKIFIKMKKTISVMFCFSIALNMFCENYITLYIQRSAVTKDQEQTSMLTDCILEDVNRQEGDTFFRIETQYHEGRMPSHDYPIIFPMRGISFYNTTISKHLSEFREKMTMYDVYFVQNYDSICSPINNPVTEDLLGIKYLISDNSAYEYIGNEWKFKEQYNNDYGVNLYQNPNINSAGLLFDYYICEDEADNIDQNERMLGMGQRIILDLNGSRTIEYADYLPDLKVNSDTLLDIHGVFAYMGEVLDSCITEDNILKLNVVCSNETSVIIPIKTDEIKTDKAMTMVNITLNKIYPVKYIVYSNSSGEWISPININQTSEGENETYSFILSQDACSVGIAMDFTGQADINISAQTVDTLYTSNGVDLKNPKMSGIITGSVKTGSNCILFLPIPYDNNWSAKIDGEFTKIFKANYGFVAVAMPAGEHNIELYYDNMLFRIGIIISAAGFSVMIASISCIIIKRHFHQSKLKKESVKEK